MYTYNNSEKCGIMMINRRCYMLHMKNRDTEVRDGGGRNTPPGTTPPSKPSYSTPKPNNR